MEEQLQNQHQSDAENQEELGFEHQSVTNQSLSPDLNPQNPPQSPPLLSEDDVDVDEDDCYDEKAMRIISDELQDLVVSQAYLDREKNQSYVGSEKSGGCDDGYGDVYGDHDGYDVYGEDDRSGGGYGGDGVFKEGDKGGGEGFNGSNGRRLVFHYPLRPDAEDCAYYMKTGNCKFGFHCKFNHPRRKTQWPKDKGTQKEEYSERTVQTECKFYLTSGGCKYGESCKFNHSRDKPVIQEFNFLGLPMRLGEKECPYYMRTGSCKYGSNCRFHHPDPTIMAGDDSSGFSKGKSVNMQGSSQSTANSWSSSRPTNETSSYVPPMMYPPTQRIPSPTSEWNSYQAPVYQASEKTLPTPPAFAMGNSVTEKFNPRHAPPLLGEDYPERPGQPECSYFIKTGDCKYRSNCKFHHPKTQLPRTQTLLNDKGLPLRPDQAICSFYSRYGICKFGPACKFDHPDNYRHSPSSDWSDFDQPPFGNPDNTDGARMARKGSGSGSLVQQSV